MTDKITSQGRSSLDITRSRAPASDATPRSKTAESGKPAAEARDSVQLTDTATNLKRIEAKLADVPEVDQSRVDEIRQRLQSNTYEIDAEQVAQKILQLDQDLG